jgi:hypothetical protein
MLCNERLDVGEHVFHSGAPGHHTIYSKLHANSLSIDMPLAGVVKAAREIPTNSAAIKIMRSRSFAEACEVAAIFA